jgi:autotransporter-associated beta strand protein
MKILFNPFFRPANLIAALTFALSAGPVLAVPLYWDGTTTSVDADGGNGTWDNGTTANWDTAATGGSDSVWTNGNNTAVFGGAAGTVTLGNDITVGSLQMDTSGYEFTSTGLQTLTIVNMAETAQLFTGSLGVKFACGQINSSILTNSANTFSGGITIGGGGNDRFLLGWGTTIGTGTPGALTNGVWGTGAVTLGVTAADRSQILMNGGSITINNALVFNSALGNTDAGGAVRLEWGDSTINGAINANLADANFRTGGGGTPTLNLTGAISGASGLRLLAGNGTGTLKVTLSNTGVANSYAGNTTISSATETLTLGAADQIPNGTGKGNLIVTAGNFKMGGFSETINGLSGSGTVDGVSGTPTLTVGDNDATSTFSGIIKNTAGTLALTKTGSGTLTLSGNNSYGGATTVSGGTLKAGSTTGLSANSALSVGAGATLDLGGFNNTIKSLSTATGTITDSSGSGLGGTLKIATAMPGGLSAQLFTGSMGLQFYGGNTVDTILSNTANTYSGGTIIGNGSGSTSTRILLGGGTLGAGSPGAVTSGLFGTGAITIGAAATDKSQLFFSNAITINNDLVVNTEAGTDITGTFRVEAGGSILAGAINSNLADAKFFAFGGGSISVTGAISGASGLKLDSTSWGNINVTLNHAGAANSYAGNTTLLSAGSTLALGAANQIPNGAGKGNLVVTAGTFHMGGFSEAINGLSGAGTVDGTTGTPTLTVGDNNATSTFDGMIKNTNGALELAKTGNGTLTLTGDNSYSGATNVNGGTMLVNGAQTGGGAVNVASTGTLGGSGSVIGAINVSGVLAPGSSIESLGGGTLSFAGASTYAYELQTLGLNGDLAYSSGALNIASGTILTLTDLGTSTALANGSKLTLISSIGAWNGGLFTYAGNPLTDDSDVTLGANKWRFNYNDNLAGSNFTSDITGATHFVTLTVVPEPNVAAMLGGLGTLLLLRRRR